MAVVGAPALASARRASAAAAFSTTTATSTRTRTSRPASPPPTAGLVTLSFSGAGHLLPYHLGVASSLHRASANGGKSNHYDNAGSSKQPPLHAHAPVSLPGPIRAVSGSSSGAVAATVLVRLPHRIEEYADAFLAEGGRAVAILRDMLHDEERRLVSVSSAAASGEGDDDGTATEGRSRVEVLSPGQAAHHTTRRVGGGAGGGGRILTPPQKTGGATAKSSSPPPPLPPSLHIATTRCDTGNLRLFDFRPVHAEFRTISASWTNDELLRAVEASCRIPRSFHPADVLESPFLGGMLGAFGGGGGSASTYPDEDGVCINGRWYVDGGIAAPAPPTPLDRADGAIRVVISPISGGPLVEEAEDGDEMITRRGRQSSHRISPPDDTRRLLPFALRLRGGLSVFPSVQNLRALGISAGAASRDDLMRWYDAGREDGAKFLRDVRL